MYPYTNTYKKENIVCLSAASRDSEALKCFDKAIELKPELAAAHCNRANIYKSSNRANDAVTGYQEAVRLNPEMQTAWFGLSHVLNEVGEYAEALKAASKSIELSGSKVHIPSHNERLFALIKLDRSEEAIADVDILTREVPMDKSDPNARKLYAMVLSQRAIALTTSGDHKNALDMHQRAVDADASFKNLFNLAISQIQNEKQGDALKTLQRAKAIDASNWKLHAAIGTINMQQQNYEPAAEAFAAAAKFKEAENDETVNFNAGVAYMNLGKEDEAQKYLEKVTKVNRDNWTAQALLGTIYIGQEKYQLAQNVLEVAAQLSGGANDSSVLYNLGYAQLMLNNKDSALGSFKQALTIDPESSQAKSAVQALEDSPDQIKKALDNLPKEQKLDANTMKEFEAVKDDPLARAKIIVAPQRPPYLRRVSSLLLLCFTIVIVIIIIVLFANLMRIFVEINGVYCCWKSRRACGYVPCHGNERQEAMSK